MLDACGLSWMVDWFTFGLHGVGFVVLLLMVDVCVCRFGLMLWFVSFGLLVL